MDTLRVETSHPSIYTRATHLKKKSTGNYGMLPRESTVSKSGRTIQNPHGAGSRQHASVSGRSANQHPTKSMRESGWPSSMEQKGSDTFVTHSSGRQTTQHYSTMRKCWQRSKKLTPR